MDQVKNTQVQMIMTASTNHNMEEPGDEEVIQQADNVGKGHERKKDSC